MAILSATSSAATAIIYTDTHVEFAPAGNTGPAGADFRAVIWQSPTHDDYTEAWFDFNPATARLQGLGTDLDEGSNWWVDEADGREQILKDAYPFGNGVVVTNSLNLPTFYLSFTSATGPTVPITDPNRGLITGWIQMTLSGSPGDWHISPVTNAIAYGQAPIAIGETPEPASCLLLTAGIVVGAGRRRR